VIGASAVFGAAGMIAWNDFRISMEAVFPDTTVAGRVTRVIDGDTFRLDCCRASIRLWGIDAPERRTRRGPAATRALRSLIAARPLTCRQRDIDRYGRIVGQCTLPDGSDLGDRLLATGTVREYCYFSRNHYRTC